MDLTTLLSIWAYIWGAVMAYDFWLPAEEEEGQGPYVIGALAVIAWPVAMPLMYAMCWLGPDEP